MDDSSASKEERPVSAAARFKIVQFVHSRFKCEVQD